MSRLPAASLPRVPAHLSPVASSPWWCRACAVPIARVFGLLRDCARCLSTSCSRVVDRRFMRRTKVAASRRWLLAFGCVARYYFLATFGARRWRSSPSVGRLMVFQDFLSFLVFLETSEVAGPGPNPREIDISSGADGPLACARPDPTIGWTDVLPCVLVCLWRW